jgi:K+-transporting ATPase KdpF subunit
MSPLTTTTMTDTVYIGILALLLIGYLLVAMIHPEKF